MTKKKKTKKATPPAAIETLKNQHREVEDLFEEFEEAADEEDFGKARELASRICEELTLHATIEEEIFYPAVQSEETEDQLAESEVEHLSAKRLIADVAATTSDKKLKALMSVLKEQVEHHVEEEEETLFPQVLEEVAEDELEPMGERLEERYEELKSRGVGKVNLPAAEADGDDEEEEVEEQDGDDEDEDEDDVSDEAEESGDESEDDDNDDDMEQDASDEADDDDDDDLDDDEAEPIIEPHKEMPTITKKPAATKRKR